MRIPPKLPAGSYKMYGIGQPIGTHFRPATCDEVDCPAYLRGWRTTVDPRTDLGASQAHYIESESSRQYVKEQAEDGMAVYTFTAGQQCFGSHRKSLERPANFIVRERGHTVAHSGGDAWVDDFSTHQERLRRAAE